MTWHFEIEMGLSTMAVQLYRPTVDGVEAEDKRGGSSPISFETGATGCGIYKRLPVSRREDAFFPRLSER